MILPRTAISLRLRVIPPGSGLARRGRPIPTRVGTRVGRIGHRPPDQTRARKDTGMMDRLMEYTLDQYQKRIDRLKQLKPDTIGYECLLKDIDGLQEKLDQLRRQIVERRL